MRVLIAGLSAILLASLPIAAASGAEARTTQIQDELRSLFAELNEAHQKRDRAALERIYAEEFVWIHAAGYIDDRTVHIADMLSVDSPGAIPTPSFDDLRVYGDVAVLKATGSRGATGGFVNTSIFARRNGRWQIVQIQGTLLLPQRQAVQVAPEILDSYTGRYLLESGETLNIAREGEGLVLQLKGLPKRSLVATSELQFFDKLGSELTFSKAESGKVTHFDIRLQSGQERRWEKVE